METEKVDYAGGPSLTGRKRRHTSRCSVPPSPENESLTWFLALLRRCQQHITLHEERYLVAAPDKPFKQNTPHFNSLLGLTMPVVLERLKETFSTARCKAQLSIWKSLYLSTAPAATAVRTAFIQWLREGDASQLTEEWRSSLVALVPELTEKPFERTPQGKLINTAGRRMKSWKRILKDRPNLLYELRDLAVLPHPTRILPSNIEKLLAYLELLTTITPDGAVCRNESDQIFLAAKILTQLPELLLLAPRLASDDGGLLAKELLATPEYDAHMQILSKYLPQTSNPADVVPAVRARPKSQGSPVVPQPPTSEEPERFAPGISMLASLSDPVVQAPSKQATGPISQLKLFSPPRALQGAQEISPPLQSQSLFSYSLF